MALINCTECGREVSDKAAACPGCGAPIAAPAVRTEVRVVQMSANTKSRGAYIVLGLFFGAFGINNFYAAQYGRGAAKLGFFTVALAMDAITGFYSAFSLVVLGFSAFFTLIELFASDHDGHGVRMT